MKSKAEFTNKIFFSAIFPDEELISKVQVQTIDFKVFKSIR